MKIDRETSSPSSANIRVYPFSEVGENTFTCNTQVSVYQTMSFATDPVWGEAGVSWPSLGTTPTDRARLFAQAILLACDEADKLNERKGKGRNEH
jgi:hypothetical protein